MKRVLKKNNEKISFIRVIMCIFVIFLVSIIVSNYGASILKNVQSISNNLGTGYSVIKLDVNKNYSGIGQEKIDNKDGYFTTFTTDKPNKKVYKEYKQNSNSSWSNNSYWSGKMSDNGCGINAISIILSGYNENYTPESLRKKYYPVLNNDLISNELTNTFKLKNSDFCYDSTRISTDYIKKHLETNRPILICVWTSPSKNRWTTASHYMVLLATDGNNMVYVSNPNGLSDTSKNSGWYNMNEVVPYIAKALFIESY